VDSLLTSYAPEAPLSHRGRYEAIFFLPTAFHPRSIGATLRWYELSVVLSVAALAIMVLLRPLMEHSIFFLFLASVAISALYGGLGPGLVATVLSTVACGFFFLPPRGPQEGREPTPRAQRGPGAVGGPTEGIGRALAAQGIPRLPHRSAQPRIVL
jgi:hypothetical protein